MNPRNFFAELKRRNVPRAAAFYNVVGMRAVFLSDVNGFEDLSKARQAWATFPPGTTLFNPSQVGNSATLIGDGAYLYTIDRDFTAALKSWEVKTSSPDEERSRLAARVTLHVLKGDAAAAPDEIAKAKSLVEAKLQAEPGDVQALSPIRHDPGFRQLLTGTELIGPSPGASGKEK